MAIDYAEVGVLYNDGSILGVRFHKVPRDLFDLIPGDARELPNALRSCWTKSMFLADGAGNQLSVTMYCDEDPASPIEG